MLGIKLSSLIIGTVASITSCQPQKEVGYYPTTTVISNVCEVEVDTEKKYWLTLEDFNGNAWGYISEDGDWLEGDIVNLIMCDNGTEKIEDDIIIYARYSGYSEE